MSRAQGEYRGPARDAEEQYAAGDAAVAVGTTEQAARATAFRLYQAQVAALDLQEVWDQGVHVGYRQAHADRAGQVLHYLFSRHPLFWRELGQQRADILGY